MFYVYILRSRDDKRFYTGYTQDLRKRLDHHNNRCVRPTSKRGALELVYYEACLNQQDATAREKYLKTGMGKRYIKNRIRRFLSLTG